MRAKQYNALISLSRKQLILSWIRNSTEADIKKNISPKEQQTLWVKWKSKPDTYLGAFQTKLLYFIKTKATKVKFCYENFPFTMYRIS